MLILKLTNEDVDQIINKLLEVEKTLRGEEANKIYDLITEIKVQKKYQINNPYRYAENLSRTEKAISSEDN